MTDVYKWYSVEELVDNRASLDDGVAWNALRYLGWEVVPGSDLNAAFVPIQRLPKRPWWKFWK